MPIGKCSPKGVQSRNCGWKVRKGKGNGGEIATLLGHWKQYEAWTTSTLDEYCMSLVNQLDITEGFTMELFDKMFMLVTQGHVARLQKMLLNIA